MLRALVAAVLLAAVGLAGQPTPTVQAAEPLRVMIIGDSVTHGSNGDWTWRYWLWKRFQDAGVAVDFVGPRDGVFDLDGGPGESHDYLDPNFDRDHAARWGMSLTFTPVPIADLVAAYQPDVVVEMLGAIDLVFSNQTVAQVNQALRDLVSRARSVDPDVDFVLVPPFQGWFRDAPLFSDGLPGLAEELDSSDSQVVASSFAVAPTASDSWDGSHPAATGEVKIAASVGVALGQLGIEVGSPTLTPTVENGPPDPAQLWVTDTTATTVTLAWTPPPGARDERVWMRDVTTGEEWRRLPSVVYGTTWTGGYLTTGHHYEFRLQSGKRKAVAEHVFSNVVDVWPAFPPPAAVADLTLAAVDHGLDLAWSAAPAASTYRVSWWPTTAPAEVTTQEIAETALTIGSLRAGRRYAVSVEAVGAGGAGPPTVVEGVPAGPVPGRPELLPVTVDRRHRAQVTWAADPVATSYLLSLDGQPAVPVVGTAWRSRVLVVGRHVVTVRAWAEDVPGPLGRIRFRVR